MAQEREWEWGEKNSFAIEKTNSWFGIKSLSNQQRFYEGALRGDIIVYGVA